MNKRYLALTVPEVEYNDPMDRHIAEELVRLAMPPFAMKLHERWQNVTMFDEEPEWQFVVCYQDVENG